MQCVRTTHLAAVSRCQCKHLQTVTRIVHPGIGPPLSAHQDCGQEQARALGSTQTTGSSTNSAHRLVPVHPDPESTLRDAVSSLCVPFLTQQQARKEIPAAAMRLGPACSAGSLLLLYANTCSAGHNPENWYVHRLRTVACTAKGHRTANTRRITSKAGLSGPRMQCSDRRRHSSGCVARSNSSRNEHNVQTGTGSGVCC